MPFPKNVLLIVNPIAGDTDKTELIEYARQKADELGFTLHLYQTDGENDEAEINQLITTRLPDRVLVAGGDGTIRQVAAMVQNTPIVLGILPAGSANGLATTFDIPNTPENALDIALGESTSCMDGVRMNGHIGLHLSDLGLNARLVKNYEEGETRGKLGYAKEVIRTLTEHTDFRVRITTDTEIVETAATIVIIANARKYGTGVVINPGGHVCDGKFEVIVATRFDFVELVRLIAGSTELDPEVVKVYSTTKADIECLEGQVLFQVDGEFMGEVTHVHAEIIPGMLQLAVPELVVQ